MDYNDYYRNTTVHDEEVKEQRDPNQLEPKKAIKGYIIILFIIIVVVGLYIINEKLDENDSNNSNSNSDIVSNSTSN